MDFHTNRNEVKDVKEWSRQNRPVSSGRDCHAPQVTPDRHQASVEKLKTTQKLKIATWNVRTVLQKGKLENIKKEMARLKLNILGLSEMRWKGAGTITSGTNKLVYSGGAEHEGILFDQATSKSLKGFWSLSDRVLLVKIEGKPFDINII